MCAPEPLDDESDSEEDLDAGDGKDQDFSRVISDMAYDALQDDQPLDSVLMEIKGYKFAQNKVSNNTFFVPIQHLLRVITEFW